MDILDEDLIALWRALNDCDVAYIVVGGLASILNGASRTTQDVDIWIKNTIENRKNLRQAFALINIGDFKEIETLQFVSGFTTIFLKKDIELDLFTDLKYFSKDDFDECYNKATVAQIDTVEIKFLHINQLIQEKEANNRQKDKLDLEELYQIKKLQDNN